MGNSLLRIVVKHAFTGEELVLDLNAWSSVADLKAAINHAWQIPERFQTIVAGSELLHDHSQLLDSQSYQLILTIDSVRHDVEAGSFQQQIQALSDLQRLGCKVGYSECLINTIVAQLESEVASVRDAVIETLRMMTWRNYDLVIAAVTDRLHHLDHSVRRAALQALSAVLETGDERGILLICACLQDGVADVRRAAIQSLSLAVERGNEQVIVALSERLDDVNPLVRIAALKMLQEVPSTVSAEVSRNLVSAVMARFKDTDVGVRMAAQAALHKRQTAIAKEQSSSNNDGLTHCPSSPNGMPRNTFRNSCCYTAGYWDGIGLIVALVGLCINLMILKDLVPRLSRLSVDELPADVWAGFIYTVASLGTACLIDRLAVVHMFVNAQALPLNWIAAVGVTFASLKLAMVNRVRNYETVSMPNVAMAYDLVSGDLQLNALVRDGSEWYWEAHFGNISCTYLATTFAFTLLSANRFRARQLMTKSALYLGASLTLGTFSGFFASAGGPGIRWLLLLHLLIPVVACCQPHVRGNPHKAA